MQKKRRITGLVVLLLISSCGCGKAQTTKVSDTQEKLYVVATETIDSENEEVLETETEEILIEETTTESETNEEIEVEENNEPEEYNEPTEYQEEEAYREPESESVEPEPKDWVSNLGIASSSSQLIVVAASGSSATVSMHNKDSEGNWSELFCTNGYVGQNGVGQASEYSPTTPSGVYGFSKAFGIMPNPGTSLSYSQVDESIYWVDDINSPHYNQYVSTNDTPCDWNSAEHIISCGSLYNYVLAIDYNSACIPGAGSAIFLHCSSGRETDGCVSVPQDIMITIFQNIQPGCRIIIDTTSGVYNY